MRNLQGLQDATVDIGLAQAGIAYMAYNGRLNDSEGPMRDIRGIAVLNPSAVQLLVAPSSPIRDVDQLRGRRVGIGPRGGAAATTSGLVLYGYFSPDQVEAVNASVAETTAMLLTNRLDAAFTITSIPNDEVVVQAKAGARLLPIRGPAADRLRARFPFFRAEIIPAGAYP
jgi:TRAP transporter TAXI family solute receptor